MGETLRLPAVLEPRGPAGGFTFSEEQVAALGDGAKAFPVIVPINGTSIPLRLVRRGDENLVGFSKANRAAAGIELGDEVTFDIAADLTPRTVEMPDDLAAALASDPAAQNAFEEMAYSRRKEYVRWVTEAKRAQTRADRITTAVAKVRAGETR